MTEPLYRNRKLRLKKTIGPLEITDGVRERMGASRREFERAGYEWVESVIGGFMVWRKKRDEVLTSGSR